MHLTPHVRGVTRSHVGIVASPSDCGKSPVRIEIIVVFLVVEIIPDIVKTTTNVTAHADAAAIVDRGVVSEPSPAE